MIVVIIDDKQMNIQLLESMLGTLATKPSEIHAATTIEHGIELLESIKPDLVFLDIELGNGYGYDVLDGASYKTFELIFVSAHPQFALKSYKYNPLHYLLKPVSQDDLAEGMQRYFQRKGQEHGQIPEQMVHPSKPTSRLKKRISLPENGRLQFIDLADIIYLESSNVYTIFHIEGRNPLVVSKALSIYETMLPEASFYRIHDRYIVNLRQVRTYTRGRGGEVELANGQELTVASRRKQEFLSRMNELSLS